MILFFTAIYSHYHSSLIMYNAKIITNYYHISLKYENDRSRLPSSSNSVDDCTRVAAMCTSDY